MKKRPSFSVLLRLFLLLLSLGFSLWYFLSRNNKALMNSLCDSVVRPYHRFMGTLTGRVSFSVALWVILAAAAFVLLMLFLILRRACRPPRSVKKLLESLLTLSSVASLAFALFCLFWGVYYYADSFSDRSGLCAEPVSVETLRAATQTFADFCNDCGAQVERAEDGSLLVTRAELFERSPDIYAGAEKIFPCLAGPSLRAKPFGLSKAMSYWNYTGFFFPYTGEANLNADSPICMLPATIAHELAHQRGVAREDEANFAGILACLESGDVDYAYSGALLGYTYLGNALYEADRALWEQVYSTLSAPVVNDLRSNNAYWKTYETPIRDMSEKVYTSFLQTYGDSRGMASYGACVDLLCAYYSR